MSEPHVIRLRHPWEAEPTADAGATIWRRRFGRPSGLDSGERVWLCLRAAGSLQTVRLNELEPSLAVPNRASVRVDVTAQLQERNLVEVTVAAPRTDDAPFEAWLEIAAGERPA